MSLEFFSAPIFKFKVSMDLSHQARLNGVVLKIDQAVLEILIKNHFVRNTFSLISRELSPFLTIDIL